MPRSRAFRAVSIALLFLAGSFEPVWEIGHAFAHRETVPETHHQWEGAPDRPDRAPATVGALHQQDGHSHPVLQSPLRPASGQTLAIAALPAAVFLLPLPDLAVRRSAFPGTSARAGPTRARATQPRAPPLS